MPCANELETLPCCSKRKYTLVIHGLVVEPPMLTLATGILVLFESSRKLIFQIERPAAGE